MSPVTSSGCINHPGVEAIARCKQCGKPVCGACVVRGPTGTFCTDGCRDRHESFIVKAREIDRTKRSVGLFVKLRILLLKTAVFVLALGSLGFVSFYFNVPIAAGISWWVWKHIAPYLPFLR